MLRRETEAELDAFFNGTNDDEDETETNEMHDRIAHRDAMTSHANSQLVKRAA